MPDRAAARPTRSPAVMPTAMTRRSRLATAIVMFMLALAALFLPSAPAQGASLPAAGLATDVTATDTCTPDGATGCVIALVKGADGTPLADVTVTLTAPDGTVVEGTSAADGRAQFAVTSADTFTVAVDPETLPASAGGQIEPVEKSVLFGSNTRVALNAASEGGTGGSSAQPSTGTSAPTTATPPAAGGTQDATWLGISDRVWQQFAFGIRFSLILALASVGANLIYGTTKLSNFAHGEQVTLGAVVAYLLVRTAGLPLWAAGILTVVILAATGWLQDAWIWKPLRRRGTPITQVMIVTIGLSLALQFFIQFIVGSGAFQVVTGNPKSWTIGPIAMTDFSYLAMGISIVALAAVSWFLTRTRLGQATRAVSDNPALAAATGINTNTVIRLVWTLATGLAGLGGLLYALTFGSATYLTGGQMLLLMFAAITLGGLGTANGALVGSLVIGVTVEMSSLFLPADLRYATALFILIVVLLVRPSGILGQRDRIG